MRARRRGKQRGSAWIGGGERRRGAGEFAAVRRGILVKAVRYSVLIGRVTGRRLAAAIALAGWAVAGFGQPLAIGMGEETEKWEVIASDGVEASVESIEGRGLRLHFDFRRGAGFCVLRREVELELAERYRLAFEVRGEGPANTLEFKLASPSGEDVWWVVRRDFSWPKEWKRLSQRSRHFKFAWGPSGGKRLERAGAIEFAISASKGGKGWVDFAGLEFEALEEARVAAVAALVTVSSEREGEAGRRWELHSNGRLDWRSGEADEQPTATVDFGGVRELGGVTLEWGAAFASAYNVLLSSDGRRWERAASVSRGNGGRDMVAIPDGEARFLRVEAKPIERDRGIELKSLRVHEVEWSETPNAFAANVAKSSSRGWYPRYALEEQTYWTVIGTAGDEKEALIDADGAIEWKTLGPRIEPFIWVDGELITWEEAAKEQTLLEGCLPIPTVTWRGAGVRLEITAIVDGPAGGSELKVRYRVALEDERMSGRVSLFLALRPFQVLPPWQALNLTGGVAKLGQVERQGETIRVNETDAIRLWTRPSGFGASIGERCDVVEDLARGELPGEEAARDEEERCSAALRYDLELEPGSRADVYLSVPLHGASEGATWKAVGGVEEWFEESQRRVTTWWREELNRVRLDLPESGRRIAETFRSTQAYILINADGPSIQPGSRTYERSWIRDGCLTSTALMNTGHAEQVRRFIEWFAPYQYENGKIPCVVDGRGPDPVPEHDSTGQFIYLVAKYLRMTGDRALARKMQMRVDSAVAYIESLRAQRMTAEFREGPAEKRALYGIVPESISHEGYSAKPMHSYWDSFWVMRGLKDAAWIAEWMGHEDLKARYARLRDAYRGAMVDSIKLAMKNKEVDYIPGCAELGDFDATSTAIVLFPCEEATYLPREAVKSTFERYDRFFRDRRDGRIEWRDYTPYELRLIGTFVRLGQAERAHAMLDYFLKDQRPAGWNHWAEVVYRDAKTPGFIGDMPHTWCGTEFLNSVRTMFVYECEEDASLRIGAGIRAEWVRAGEKAAIEGFPTEYGELSYSMRGEAGRVRLSLTLKGRMPPGGIVWENSLGQAFGKVQVAEGEASASGKEIRIGTERVELSVEIAP